MVDKTVKGQRLKIRKRHDRQDLQIQEGEELINEDEKHSKENKGAHSSSQDHLNYHPTISSKDLAMLIL